MYQTIGIVRYSGCSGSATPYSKISLWIGERRAASSQSSAMPSLRAAAITSGSCGSSRTLFCASYRSFSSGTEAASATRSAS